MEKEKEKEKEKEEKEKEKRGVSESSESDSADSEEEVEKLEEEVGVMGEKLYELRSTLPTQLHSTLSTILSTQRHWVPHLSLSSQSPTQPTLSGDPNVVLSADDGEAVDEIQLLREKISSNITAMPGVLKRMKDCISRIDKLVSSNETIHPSFKRKKR